VPFVSGAVRASAGALSSAIVVVVDDSPSIGAVIVSVTISSLNVVTTVSTSGIPANIAIGSSDNPFSIDLIIFVTAVFTAELIERLSSLPFIDVPFKIHSN
jgi:hypothetical protein